MSSVVSDDSLHRSSRISFAPGTKEGATILHGADEDLLEVDEVGELLSAPAGQAFPSFSLDVDPFEAHVSREATPALDAHVLPETQIPEECIAQFEEDARANPWLVDDTGKAWTSTHIKIIALISLYGRSALKSIDNETWVLQVPLMVLIYEGIARHVLDGDYAPASTLVSIQGHPTRRIWMNISQEGKGAVDDLREAKLLNGLKLNSQDSHIVTAYQVSKRGLKLLARAPTALRLQVELFCTEPATTKRGILLDPVYSLEEGCFQLISRSGMYVRNSKITDCEDVSYVSSPFIPSFLLPPGTVLESFSHRARESAAGESGIEDELSEEIQLAYVKIVVAEYIPFGNNLMAQLNRNLGVEDRIQGGMFTSAIDKNSSTSSLQLDPGLTDLKIVDYDYFSFANITAEINFPEDEGIVQIENFGIHMHKYGLVICGMKLEAILDRNADDISLDHLARVLVDVQQDSSKIMNDIISEAQRNLMNLVFMGDEMSRCKYNLIMSSRIIPKMRATHYMDRGRFEKEIKQVIGDLISVHDLSPTDLILLGTLGCIVCGPNIEHHEEMIVCYVSLLVKDVFMRSFFDRMFTAYNHLSNIKRMLSQKDTHPENVQVAQEKIQAVSKDIVQLSDLLTFIFDSCNNLVIPAPSTSIFGKQLNDVLDCKQLKQRMIDRCNDLDSILTGYKHELSALQEQLKLAVGGQLLSIYQNTASNTDIMYKNSKKKELQLFPSLIMQVGGGAPPPPPRK
jgi:WD repeat-containing protein 35